MVYGSKKIWLNNQRIISAEKPDGVDLVDVTIFHLNDKSNLIEKIIAKRADISNNDWVLKEVVVFKQKNNILEKRNLTLIKFNQSIIMKK